MTNAQVLFHPDQWLDMKVTEVVQLMHEVVKLALTAGEAILPFWRAVPVTRTMAPSASACPTFLLEHCPARAKRQDWPVAPG